MKYLVQQIGCIECGVSSYAIKTTKTLEEAKLYANAHPSTWDSEGGDGYVEVLNLETLQTEYVTP